MKYVQKIPLSRHNGIKRFRFWGGTTRIHACGEDSPHRLSNAAEKGSSISVGSKIWERYFGYINF